MGTVVELTILLTGWHKVHVLTDGVEKEPLKADFKQIQTHRGTTLRRCFQDLLTLSLEEHAVLYNYNSRFKNRLFIISNWNSCVYVSKQTTRHLKQELTWASEDRTSLAGIIYMLLSMSSNVPYNSNKKYISSSFFISGQPRVRHGFLSCSLYVKSLEGIVYLLLRWVV